MLLLHLVGSSMLLLHLVGSSMLLLHLVGSSMLLLHLVCNLYYSPTLMMHGQTQKRKALQMFVYTNECQEGTF